MHHDFNAAFQRFSIEDTSQSITSRFEHQVERYLNNLAVQWQGEAITYGSLDEAANRVANAILAQPGAPTLTVGVLLEQGAALITAILGILKAGKIYVPLDVAYPVGRSQQCLADARAGILITNTSLLSIAYQVALPNTAVINLNEIAVTAPSAPPRIMIPADAPAYIIYTSGTTGKPKGVLQTHRNVLHMVMNYTNSLSITAQDRLSQVAPAVYSASIMDIFGALLNGAALLPFDLRCQGIDCLTQWLQEERISLYHCTPTIFRLLLKTLNGTEDFTALRAIDLGGDVVYRHDVALYHRFFPPTCFLVNGYGLTESNVNRQFFITHTTPNNQARIPVGYPVRDVDIFILGANGEKLGYEQEGKIAIQSRYLSPGYWGQPDLTREKYLFDPAQPERRIYRTGDLGILHADGCLEHLGRLDFQVKIRGQRVELAEIETVLMALPEVKQAVVILHQVNEDTQLAAYLTPTALPGPSNAALRQALAKSLPSYMIPSIFVILPALPLNHHGKLDRTALPAPLLHPSRLETPAALPTTEIEREIAGIWRQVLHLPEVSIHDNFLELGGNSLNATQVVSRINDLFQLNLLVSAVFNHPTIASLASLIPQHPDIETKVVPSSIPALSRDRFRSVRPAAGSSDPQQTP